jgi:phosphate starvation-inducible PhoH-like protein
MKALLLVVLVCFLKNMHALTLTMKTSRVSKLKKSGLTPLYQPRTPNQRKYLDKITDYNSKVIIGLGPAGTGKTLFACLYAIQELEKGNIEKIVLTRPIVTVEEDIGYLPGKLNSKMEPWTRPIFDILREYHSNQQINSMLQSGVIEIAPLAYMRGRTFKRSIIIADEMQNSSPNQMLMISTRLGDNSKLIITGDLNQSDRMNDNGLKDLVKKIEAYPLNCTEISTIHFQQNDIQRSPIVSKILDIYEYKIRKLPIPTINQNKIKKYSKKIDNDAAIIPLSDMKKINKK